MGRWLRYSGLGLLALVLAVGPFRQGLFFWTSLLGAIAAVCLGFGLWMLGRRRDGLPVPLPGGAAGWALLALLAAYLLQFAWAVYPRGNLDWFLRVAAAWAAYAMVRAEAGPALRRWLAWLLLLTAAGLTVAGFLEFTGYFAANPELMQALGLVSLTDRMATPLQYPNTAAVYLLAALLAAIGLALDRAEPWRMAVTTGLATLLSLGFFFTVSRGAVVVLPIGLIVLLLGLSNGQRWPALLQLAVAWAPALVALKGVGANAAIHNPISAFRWIAAATVAGLAGGAALSCFLRLGRRWQYALVGGAVLLAVAGLLVLRPSAGLLPKQAARLLDINLRTGNVIYRFTLDADAARMVADRPLGRGGWGWERSYRRYQEFYYVGRETHNHFLQTAVEAGLPGLAALTAAVGAGLWAAWRNRRDGPLGWTLAAGAALIAAHSLIDFDLSYGSVWLLFWCLLAAAGRPTDEARPAAAAWAGVAGALVAAAGACVLGIGSWYADRADTLAAAGRPADAAAAAAAQAALRYDPWNSAPLVILGDAASLRRAVRLDPQQARPHFDLAVVLNNSGDYEGALQEARAAVANAPLLSSHYAKLASVAGNLMVDALHKGDGARARELARELAALGQDFFRRKAAETKGGPWMGPRLEMSADFKLRYGQALFLTGDIKGAQPYLADAAKVGLLGSEAELWLYVIYERQGNRQAMAALESKPWIRFRSANPVYAALRDWR